MTLDEKNTFLKNLDAQAFRDLGAPFVAYVREVEFHGQKHFSIHSADGHAVALATNMDQALDTIQAQDMEPIILH